jgi:hypothetical protein
LDQLVFELMPVHVLSSVKNQNWKEDKQDRFGVEFRDHNGYLVKVGGVFDLVADDHAYTE